LTDREACNLTEDRGNKGGGKRTVSPAALVDPSGVPAYQASEADVREFRGSLCIWNSDRRKSQIRLPHP